jgi:hypothetical protein
MAPGGIEFTREDLTALATIRTALAGMNEKLDRILENQEECVRRIDALEAYREHCTGQSEGEKNAAARTAGIVAFIVSTILGAAAILVACWSA